MTEKEDLLRELCRTWEEKYRYGSIEDRKKRAALWEPYYSSVYRKLLGKPSLLPEKETGWITALREADVLNGQADVLEIGCGTGLHALQMARHCRSVLAIDQNETAIQVLKEQLRLCGGTNVEARAVPWEDFIPEQKYDLVVTSMCPAVCNLNELLRMESCSSGFCAIQTVRSGSYDKYRKKILEELDVKPEGMITEFSLYQSVLEALGRNVMTYTESFHREYTTSREELLKSFPTYLEIFGIDRMRSEPFLEEFFARHQQEGLLRDETQMNTGLLYWKAAGDRK